MLQCVTLGVYTYKGRQKVGASAYGLVVVHNVHVMMPDSPLNCRLD
jgi:hypothetical protein